MVQKIKEEKDNLKIDNFRAGERQKFKLLCQSAKELNSGLSDEKTNS